MCHVYINIIILLFIPIINGKITDVLESCFNIPKYICIAQGDNYKLIGPQPSEVGLLGWWKFDESILLDSSTHSNHLDTSFAHGPSPFGHGYSLHIKSFNPIRIPLNNSIEIKNFTISFWIYIIANNSLYFSNLVSKGNYNSQTFTILLYPDNRLSVRISTESTLSEGIPTTSKIPKLRWTFVTVTANDTRLEIYINGLLDSVLALDSPPIANYEDLIIGPFTPSYEAYLDDLKIYNHNLPFHYISSMSNPALTGFDINSSVVIGCKKCKFKEAKRPGFCPLNYSLCTNQQMYLYAAHIARVNGWLKGNEEVWHLDTINNDNERMGLCCRV